MKGERKKLSRNDNPGTQETDTRTEKGKKKERKKEENTTHTTENEN